MNISPTDGVLAIIGNGLGVRRAGLLRWGLAPSWARIRTDRPLINARDDKLRQSNAWRPLARRGRHRCLVVADGWLEWQHAEDPRQPKQPFLHRLRGGEPFAFAGLWCVQQPRDVDNEIVSCTIVTTAANREASRLHDRMPAVLASPEEQAAWLSDEVDLDGALELVRPLADGTVEISPTSVPSSKPPSDQMSLL